MSRRRNPDRRPEATGGRAAALVRQGAVEVDGKLYPPGQVCVRLHVDCSCSARLATFERDTRPGADRRVLIVDRPSGPQWTTGPDGMEKAHLRCLDCGATHQLRIDTVGRWLDEVEAGRGPLGAATIKL